MQREKFQVPCASTSYILHIYALLQITKWQRMYKRNLKKRISSLLGAPLEACDLGSLCSIMGLQQVTRVELRFRQQLSERGVELCDDGVSQSQALWMA